MRPPRLSLNRQLLIVNRQRSVAVDEALLRRRTARLLRGGGGGGGAPPALSVTLLGDPGMRRMNRQLRGATRTATVLAVPSGARGDLGDVWLGCREIARRARGGDVQAWLARFVVHAVCHLRGHTHDDAAAWRAMRVAERAALAALRADDAALAATDFGEYEP